MLALHALRIELGESYRVAVDLLSEMPGILEETGLTRIPHYTVLRTWFARIPTKTWRAFLECRSRNALATPLFAQLVLTVTIPAATTQTESTTMSGR